MECLGVAGALKFFLWDVSVTKGLSMLIFMIFDLGVKMDVLTQASSL